MSSFISSLPGLTFHITIQPMGENTSLSKSPTLHLPNDWVEWMEVQNQFPQQDLLSKRKKEWSIMYCCRMPMCGYGWSRHGRMCSVFWGRVITVVSRHRLHLYLLFLLLLVQLVILPGGMPGLFSGGSPSIFPGGMIDVERCEYTAFLGMNYMIQFCFSHWQS